MKNIKPDRFFLSRTIGLSVKMETINEAIENKN
jgi:hypothetical protein